MRNAVAVSVLLLVSCTTAQMRVDPALSAVTPMEVRGANPRTWNAGITFGPYGTTVVREGGTWGFGYRLLGIDANFAVQPYRLIVGRSEPGSPGVQAECITRAATLSRKDLSVDPSFGRIPALACGFRTGTGEGTLRLRTTATNAEEGEIVFSGRTWIVRSMRELGQIFGYEISRDGRVVAAVETINSGRVWLDPSLDPADEQLLATVATTLLLYEPVE